jgi:integrase
MDEIKISLLKRGDTYYMQYRDPVSGRKVRKSTGVGKKREAERIAGQWETDVQSGKHWQHGRMEWQQFRDVYESQRLSGLAKTTKKKSVNCLNVLDEIIAPRRLKDVNTQTLNKYQSQLRKLGRSEQTIKGHLAHIRAALSWAYDQEWIDRIPKMPKIQRAKSLKVMKGRAITLEEFERMLKAVEKVIVEPNKGKASKRVERGPDHDRIPSWKSLIRGLWSSGLRLSEAVDLHWTDETKIRIVGIDSRHPMFHIPGECEKGNQDRILPVAPEFAIWLKSLPESSRRGYVFNPKPQNKDKGRLGSQAIGRVIVDVGKTAGVVVDWKAAKDDAEDQEPKAVFASAHDLRRSFGERWASRLMPKELMELMRHKSIDTTMRFYVGQNADKTASILWEAYESASMQRLGTTLGTTSRNCQPAKAKEAVNTGK